jgi:N,N dimethylarginine dimethylhydrolase, eukaryotic
VCCVLQHAESHGTPDAVFPNNWFTTHAAGEASGSVKENTLVLYPMKAPNRSGLLLCWQMRLLGSSAEVCTTGWSYRHPRSAEYQVLLTLSNA